jgi:hypothetical protein
MINKLKREVLASLFNLFYNMKIYQTATDVVAAIKSGTIEEAFTLETIEEARKFFLHSCEEVTEGSKDAFWSTYKWQIVKYKDVHRDYYFYNVYDYDNLEPEYRSLKTRFRLVEYKKKEVIAILHEYRFADNKTQITEIIKQKR